MVQGKINRCRHTDHPAGRHSIRTNQCPPPPSPIFFTGRMPFLPPNQQCQRKLKLLYCEIAAKSESSQCALTAMSCSAVICQFLLLQIRLPYCRFCHAAQGTCYDNSVCLSVTLKWSVKTARHIIQPSNHLSATVVLVCSRLPNSYFKLSKANSLETTALDALINKQEITRQRHSHYRHTDHHHDYLIGRFPGEPGSSSSASDLPPLVLDENLWGQVDQLFYGPDTLPVTTKSKHWPQPVAQPHPFFIHQQTLEGRDLRPWRQVSNDSTYSCTCYNGIPNRVIVDDTDRHSRSFQLTLTILSLKMYFFTLSVTLSQGLHFIDLGFNHSRSIVTSNNQHS